MFRPNSAFILLSARSWICSAAPLSTPPRALTLSAFFLRVDRPTPPTPPPSGLPKPLLLSPAQSIDPLAYYAWFYDGSPLMTYLGAAGMVLVIFAGVMFPLWPYHLRLGAWYLSMGALGLLVALMVLAVVRLVIYVGTLVSLKKAIWIFPNLFEDVGVVSAFD